MVQYSNPRMEAMIDNWPLGGSKRGRAVFQIKTDPKRGERATRVTRDPVGGKFSAPKKLTFARKARIVDGDDGRTYIAELSPNYNHIVIMQGGMQYQSETIFPDNERYPELIKLFGEG